MVYLNWMEAYVAEEQGKIEKKEEKCIQRKDNFVYVYIIIGTFTRKLSNDILYKVFFHCFLEHHPNLQITVLPPVFFRFLDAWFGF